MAVSINITANSVEELQEQFKAISGMVIGYQYHPPVDAIVAVPVSEPPAEIKPVLTQEQMEENIKNAPVHEDPPQPTLEEVREAFRTLRDRKGANAVKEILKAYGAASVPELKPEDYLGARDRALTEV